MYEPQAAIDPSLAALLQTAQMVTPDGNDTVAAQYAQAAQQKMQPQGIMQGMPQAKQDYAAAAPSMMENMKRQQMQQMVREAMQPQPAGIEGLPAPNMQGMAEGGVVGFSGEFGSVVPEVEALDALRVAEAKRRRETEELRRQVEFLEGSGALQAPAARARFSQMEGPPVASAPKPPQPAAQPRPQSATPRPAASTPPPAPQEGIAQLVAPTIAAAMAAAEKQLPASGLDKNRAALEELQRMRRERPATGQMTSKALEEEGGVAAALKAKMDESARERGIMAWLLGGEGRGASARGYEGFRKAEDQRQKLHAQENTIRIAKIEAIKEANEARRIGDQEAYVNALNKITELDRADQQIKARFAADVFQAETARYGTDVGAQQRGLDRAAADKRARERNAAIAASIAARGMKPPPGMTVAELEKFQGMVDREFNPQRLGPAALAYLRELPAKEGGRSGQQLVQDIVNGNIKPGSSQWIKEVEPKLAIGKLQYAQELRKQTKYGAQPIPYSTAASLAGIAPADEED